jgi:hypothetical protein
MAPTGDAVRTGSSPVLAIRERPVTRLFLGSWVGHWTARLAPSRRSGAFRRLLGADVGAVEPRPGFSHESIEADPVLALVALLELGVDVERHLRVGVADLAHHPLHIEAGVRRRAPAASRQFPTGVQPPHPNPAARAISTAEADANQVAGKGDVEPAGQNEASMGVTPGPRTDRRPRCSQSGLAPFSARTTQWPIRPSIALRLRLVRMKVPSDERALVERPGPRCAGSLSTELPIGDAWSMRLPRSARGMKLRRLAVESRCPRSFRGARGD